MSYKPNTSVMVVVGRSNAQSVPNTAGDQYVSWDTEIRDDIGISAVGAGANGNFILQEVA